ncbi:hypothetical protein Tco_0364597 [Tanacetum coccineum]
MSGKSGTCKAGAESVGVSDCNIASKNISSSRGISLMWSLDMLGDVGFGEIRLLDPNGMMCLDRPGGICHWIRLQEVFIKSCLGRWGSNVFTDMSPLEFHIVIGLIVLSLMVCILETAQIESLEVNSSLNPLERKDARGCRLLVVVLREEDVSGVESDLVWTPFEKAGRLCMISVLYMMGCINGLHGKGIGRLMLVRFLEFILQGDCDNVTTDDNVDVTQRDPMEIFTGLFSLSNFVRGIRLLFLAIFRFGVIMATLKKLFFFIMPYRDKQRMPLKEGKGDVCNMGVCRVCDDSGQLTVVPVAILERRLGKVKSKYEVSVVVQCHFLPTGLGQHMSALEYRTILKYRLMIPLFPVDEPCPVCRKVCLDSFGEHAVHCKELPGFKYRHDLVRDVLYDVLKRAGISSRKEAPVNFLTDPLEGRSTFRPADILVFGWAGGKHACVDLTGVSPLVGLRDNGFVAGQAALKAESSKVAKHEKACLENQHVFIPFAFDTFGFLAPEAEEFLNRVQRVVQSNFSTPKTQNFIFSRIGFAIQKGVAAQLVARLPAILL